MPIATGPGDFLPVASLEQIDHFERTERRKLGPLPGAGRHANLWKAIETANTEDLMVGLTALSPSQRNGQLRWESREYDPFSLSMLELAVLEGLEPAVKPLLDYGLSTGFDTLPHCGAAELCCALPFREGCMRLLLQDQLSRGYILRTRCDASLLAVAVLCTRPRIVRMLLDHGATDEVGGETGRLWVCMQLANRGYELPSCPAKASELARALGRIECLCEFRRHVDVDDEPADAAFASRLHGIFEQERKRNEIRARLANLQVHMESAPPSAAGSATMGSGSEETVEPLSRQCKEQLYKLLKEALCDCAPPSAAEGCRRPPRVRDSRHMSLDKTTHEWYAELLTMVSQQPYQAFERGFDINMGVDHGEGRFTLLSWATVFGLPNHAMVLLEHGADATWLDSRTGVGPLHTACAQGWISLAALLLQHGASINQKDAVSGATPTNMAVIAKRVDTVRLLLDSKADALRMKSMNSYGTGESESFFLTMIATTSLNTHRIGEAGTSCFEVGEQPHQISRQIEHVCRFAYMERCARFHAYRARHVAAQNALLEAVGEVRSGLAGPSIPDEAEAGEGGEADEFFDLLLAEEDAAKTREEERALEEALAAAKAEAMAAELMAEETTSGGTKPTGSKKSKKKKNGKAKGGAAASVCDDEATSSQQGAVAGRTAAEEDGDAGAIMPAANQAANLAASLAASQAGSQAELAAMSQAASQADGQAASQADGQAASQADGQSVCSTVADVLVADELLCPITTSLFVDPVVTADGQTYERSAIEKWFASGHSTAPLTGEPLAHTFLTPNVLVRSQCVRLREQYPQLAHSMS
jgi:hypothetical protein